MIHDYEFKTLLSARILPTPESANSYANQYTPNKVPDPKESMPIFDPARMKGSDLHIGIPARILSFLEDEYAVRFMDLGIHPGGYIELMRRAPFNGAAYVRTDGGTFALRNDELDRILIA